MLERKLFAVITFFCLISTGLTCNESKTAYTEERKIVGESLYKECSCVGNVNEIVKPQWLGPGDVKIRPGSDLDIETEERDNRLSLFIKNLSITMIGTYKCQCECKGKWHTWEQLELKVYNPLQIINSPEDQSVVLGRNSEIKCEGWGGLGQRYTWWEKPTPTNKENQKYNEVTNGLVINNVTQDDKGTFVCFVSDMETGAEVNRSINVKVISHPKMIDIHPNPDHTVIAGDTLTLECIAEGTPEPTFTWQLEEPVNSSSKSKRTLGDNVRFEYNRLIIDNITAEDHGTYLCIASNKVGNDSMKINIEVLVPPKILEFNDTTVVEGTTMQIKCEAMGRPEPNVTILYIGKDVNGSKDLTDEFVITSPFMPVKPSVEGYYICNASNIVDFETSQMYLTVLHKPMFDVEKEHLWGWNGQTVNLNCENQANPKAAVVWSFEHGENEIPSEEKQQQIQELLLNLNKGPETYIAINITNTADIYGVFQCTARNEHGETTKTMYLKEGFPPSQVEYVEGKIKSTEVAFAIIRPAHEEPKVTGYVAEYDTLQNYNITNIHPNRTWSIDREDEGFFLRNLIPNTTYLIKFAAINDVGIGEWNNMTYFTTLAPSSPSSPIWDTNSVAVNATEPVSIKWNSPVDNGAPIDYYLVRYCPDCAIDSELCKELKIISNTEFHTGVLEQNTTYCVELRAHNYVGLSEAANITVTVAALTMKASLSPGAIIGIAIVIVFIAFIILDLVLCLWNKSIIVNFFFKKSKKRKSQVENTRDKKGLLKENNATVENTNKHKEFEYNKTTGIITGKHSSV